MPPRRIGLVVFDLGRVMLRLCDGWAHACRIAGVPMPAAVEDPQVRPRLQHLMYLHESGRLDCDGWARQTAELLGLEPAQVTAVSHAWLDEPYPGGTACSTGSRRRRCGPRASPTPTRRTGG